MLDINGQKLANVSQQRRFSEKRQIHSQGCKVKDKSKMIINDHIASIESVFKLKSPISQENWSNRIFHSN